MHINTKFETNTHKLCASLIRRNEVPWDGDKFSYVSNFPGVTGRTMLPCIYIVHSKFLDVVIQ